MVLSDFTLRLLCKSGVISGRVGPASVDLSLSESWSVPDPDRGGIRVGERCSYRSWDSQVAVLGPHEFMLASTVEEVSIPESLAGLVVGRSSIARLGLQVEAAGFIDPGFRGQITLELYNQTRYPIELWAGQRVCQLILFELDASVDEPYSGKYMNQSGATPSRSELDD